MGANNPAQLRAIAAARDFAALITIAADARDAALDAARDAGAVARELLPESPA